jgi:hypothetical protein
LSSLCRESAILCSSHTPSLPFWQALHVEDKWSFSCLRPQNSKFHTLLLCL